MSIVITPDFTDDQLTEEVEYQMFNGVSKKIETMEDAIRYAYGLSETRKEIDETNRLADAEVAKWQAKIEAVNSWRDSLITPLKDKEGYMASLLLGFHMDEYYNAPNDKAQKKLGSIKLPYGIVLKSTQPQVGYEIEDEDAYKAFMEANGFTETQEPKLKWGEFKKTLEASDNGTVCASGEVVDFLRVVQPDRKFEVK